jgi:uncharacterized DUF497 family protein
MLLDWSHEKNEFLKKERNISFEEIALHLSEGRLWKVTEHPNPKKYPNQRVFLVPVNDYIFFVPFIMDVEKFFLKTAFASRQATKDYLLERNKNG